jgi:hypothetical protein
LPARSTTIIGVVVALGATLLGPSLAATSAAPVDTAVGRLAATGPALNWIRLITGDEVAIGPLGSVVAVRPGAGRQGIRVTVQQTGHHLYVVPADAAALVTRGVLDRRLFDVTLLSRPEYRQQNAAGLAVIVTYRGNHTRLRSNEGVQVEHSYTSVNGAALTITGPSAAWRNLISDPAVKRVWLDAVPDSWSTTRHRE